MPKNWCFLIVVLEKTFESPLDCKEIKPVNPKGNQHRIFIGRTDAETEYAGHLMLRANCLENTLMLGKIEDNRRKGWQKMRWSDSIPYSMDMKLSKLQEIVEIAGACHSVVHGVTESQMWLSDCTKTTILIIFTTELHVDIDYILLRLTGS